MAVRLPVLERGRSSVVCGVTGPVAVGSLVAVMVHSCEEADVVLVLVVMGSHTGGMVTGGTLGCSSIGSSVDRSGRCVVTSVAGTSVSVTVAVSGSSSFFVW